MKTGEILRYLRLKNGLTQEQMGEILGVKKSAVQKYENGTIQNMKFETIRKICEMFSLSPYAIIFPDIVRNEEGISLFTYERPFQVWNNDAFSFVSLNRTGKDKVLEYISDINKIDEYRLKPIDRHE